MTGEAPLSTSGISSCASFRADDDVDGLDAVMKSGHADAAILDRIEGNPFSPDADQLMRKSSFFAFLPLMAAAIHRGMRPRPVQVLAGF